MPLLSCASDSSALMCLWAPFVVCACAPADPHRHLVCLVILLAGVLALIPPPARRQDRIRSTPVPQRGDRLHRLHQLVNGRAQARFIGP